MLFGMVVEPIEPTDTATAEVKKNCRKSVSCTWDKPVCYPTPAAAFLRRHSTRDGKQIARRMPVPLEPAEAKMYMPFEMITTPTDPEIAKLTG